MTRIVGCIIFALVVGWKLAVSFLLITPFIVIIVHTTTKVKKILYEHIRFILKEFILLAVNYEIYR